MTDENKTKLIAVTGGIGSGKTTLGQMLSNRGFTVIDSDLIAHELTQPGSPVLAEIAAVFGDSYLMQDGALDRDKIALEVFSSHEKLRKLEDIIHPRIREEYRRRALESGDDWAFILIPLLFEAGIEDTVDKIWLCYAPQDVRLTRVMERDNASREDILARINNQMADEGKIDRSDVVFNMSGTKKNVERQVDSALGELTGKRET